jgi:hypothetical protein
LTDDSGLKNSSFIKIEAVVPAAVAILANLTNGVFPIVCVMSS